MLKEALNRTTVVISSIVHIWDKNKYVDFQTELQMTCCESKLWVLVILLMSSETSETGVISGYLNTSSDAEFIPVLSIRKYFLLYYIVKLYSTTFIYHNYAIIIQFSSNNQKGLPEAKIHFRVPPKPLIQVLFFEVNTVIRSLLLPHASPSVTLSLQHPPYLHSSQAVPSGLIQLRVLSLKQGSLREVSHSGYNLTNTEYKRTYTSFSLGPMLLLI